MKLENQVCALSQAKKLNEFGVSQNSTCKWKCNEEQSVVVSEQMGLWVGRYLPNIGNEYFAAFTVAELGVMIPEWHFTYPRLEGFASYKNEDGGFAVADGTINGKNYSTEAECRAALVIYLIENNILSVKTCNERLLA